MTAAGRLKQLRSALVGFRWNHSQDRQHSQHRQNQWIERLGMWEAKLGMIAGARLHRRVEAMATVVTVAIVVAREGCRETPAAAGHSR